MAMIRLFLQEQSDLVLNYLHVDKPICLNNFRINMVIGIPAQCHRNMFIWKMVHVIIIWASSRENLSSGFPTKQVSNQSPQLQRLARQLKFLS